MDSLGSRRVALPGAALSAVAAVVALLVISPGAPAREGAAGSAGREAPRVAILFVPGPPPEADVTLIERLAGAPGLALGFASSSLGEYSPEQTLLDLGAGARTWTSLYDGELPDGMDLERGSSGWSIRGWEEAARRAETPPAEVVPGSLAQAAKGAGVAYAGLAGRLNREAIVAADRAGRVGTVSLARPRQVGTRAVELWRRARLLVARLPAGRDGSRALRAVLGARRAGDLVLVLERPNVHARLLLALGVAGIGDGAPRSDSTRTDGLVVSTDAAPTALERLARAVPDDVSGEAVSGGEPRSVGDLLELKDRLSEVGPRRWPITLLGLVGGLLLAGLLPLLATGGGLGPLLRRAFLVALWLPSVLLLTGALAPSWAGEVLLASGLAGLLALVTDRLAPGATGVAVAAGAMVIVHAVDLAFGSPLIGRSALGPNPILGARFYGVGNELEVTLALAGLIAAGAVLARARGTRLAWGLGLAGAAVAFVLSWGRLGADVGASIMLAAGTAAAVAYALGEQARGRRLAIVVIAPILALGALAALDLVTGGDAHFTRSVLRAGGLREVAEVAERRVELSYRSLTRGIIAPLVVLAAVVLAIGVWRRRAILGALRGSPGLQAAAVGGLVAVVVGALSNDSGPIIFLIGTVYMALFAGYAVSAPNSAGASGAASSGETAASIAPCGSPSSARTPGRFREALPDTSRRSQGS